MGFPLVGYFTHESGGGASIHCFTVAVLKRSVMKSLYNSFLWFCMADSLSEREISLWYYNKNWPLSPRDRQTDPLPNEQASIYSIRERTVHNEMGKYGSILHKQTLHVSLHMGKHKCYGNGKKCYPQFGQNSHHTVPSFIKEPNPFTPQSHPQLK